MALNPLNALFPSIKPGAQNKPGSGALMILQAGSRKIGEPPAKIPAALDINSTLDQSKVDGRHQLIIRSALKRLEGIRQGIIEPGNEWETKGGYLMLTGQPFEIRITKKGAVEIDAQKESGLAKFADSQKVALKKAMAQLEEIYKVVDFANKKEELRLKLKAAALLTKKLDNYYPPDAQWEKDYLLYKSLGTPAKIQLDSKGKLVMVNQFETDFSDITNEDDRLKLQQAAVELKNIRDGLTSASKGWHTKAIGYQLSKDDYYLYINDKGEVDITGNKSIKPGGLLNGLRSLPEKFKPVELRLIPDFLKPSKEDVPKLSEKWQQDALEFYKAQKPFRLDFNHRGQITAIENTFQSVTNALKVDNFAEKILQARLNILT